ncbi:sigma-54-dependent Fis family transcriptional regulator [Oceanobacillus sp. J11TS1]|uniref:sigma-54 interaction domain-containing protein n=1 Tax=Oceanobacillus sp. J11TS1 TaxID=2807191 RepID=UPI001B2ABA10|nr:sigma 54-interacting transcriptional regulator [Oceanobacillus sp. J11TS1]GIO23056.1 arginine utilization regulatory protein RocR [Oceanobacillus sp. J11TS1]
MNHLYQLLVDEINVGIHVIDQNRNTIIYNKKMMEIESMVDTEVLHKNLLEVFTFHEDERSTLVQALMTGKVTKDVKQTYFNNRGKEITTINNTFPIIENGKITAAVEIAKDITQLDHVIKKNVLRKRENNYTFDQIIGCSKPFLAVVEEAKRAARTSSSVLIVGETGTGKELFAQSIHYASPRSNAPFLAQNCAAIPENLMESILFGTKKGAFTGALDTPGLFEQADGGTLLLDEINSLDPALQAKLLRVIQEKTIRRIGDTKDKKVNVRIIATINEDPIDLIADKRLRKDLYYRLSVVTLFIPPLRERKEDILPLSETFIHKYNTLFQMNISRISEEVKAILFQHDWPGNARELEHTIEGTMNLISDETEIQIHNLPFRLRNRYQKEDKNTQPSSLHTKTLQEKMAEVEKLYILEALRENNHNVSRTAKILGMSRQNLQYRIKKFQLSLK